MTSHATDRIESRLTEAGWSSEDIQAQMVKLNQLAARCGSKSVAVKFADLGNQVGQAWGERSNGDTAWAIIRGRRVITCMMRRSTQPSTPDALKVDTVLQ